jgi:hypothetical protein
MVSVSATCDLELQRMQFMMRLLPGTVTDITLRVGVVLSDEGLQTLVMLIPHDIGIASIVCNLEPSYDLPLLRDEALQLRRSLYYDLEVSATGWSFGMYIDLFCSLPRQGIVYVLIAGDLFYEEMWTQLLSALSMHLMHSSATSIRCSIVSPGWMPRPALLFTALAYCRRQWQGSDVGRCSVICNVTELLSCVKAL